MEGMVLIWNFKSPATIPQTPETAQYDGTPGSLAACGRHDPCIVPHAVPIVEAMAASLFLREFLCFLCFLTAATYTWHFFPVNYSSSNHGPLSRSRKSPTSAFPSLALRCYVLPRRSFSVKTYIRNIDCGTHKGESTMIKIC